MSAQSHFTSFTEACIGTFIGFLVTLLAQQLIFPAYGIHIPLSADMQIVAWFTLLSVIRSYVVRRLFERMR